MLWLLFDWELGEGAEVDDCEGHYRAMRTRHGGSGQGGERSRQCCGSGAPAPAAPSPVGKEGESLGQSHLGITHLRGVPPQSQHARLHAHLQGRSSASGCPAVTPPLVQSRQAEGRGRWPGCLTRLPLPTWYNERAVGMCRLTALSCAALKSSVDRASSSKFTSGLTFILREWICRGHGRGCQQSEGGSIGRRGRHTARER